MSRFCVTESMPSRTCVVRGAHLTTCDGFTNHGRECAKDDCDKQHECTGCHPRPARDGILLCSGCWSKYTDALTCAVDLITHLRSIEKGPASVVPTRNAPGSRVILPGSWMEADNLWQGLVEIAVTYAQKTSLTPPVHVPMYDGFSSAATLNDVATMVRNLVHWISFDISNTVRDQNGAEVAVLFYRMVQRALHAYPMEERRQHLKPIRCHTCQQFTVWVQPPLEKLDEVEYQCVNPACGAFYDPSYSLHDMLVLADENTHRTHVSDDLRAQVATMLAKPAPDPLEVDGRTVRLSEVCVAGNHRECGTFACGCECHDIPSSSRRQGVADSRRRRM